MAKHGIRRFAGRWSLPHALLGLALLGVGGLVVLGPVPHGPASAATAGLVVAHLGVALVVGGILVHGHGRHAHPGAGIFRRARLYDALVQVVTLGRERRMREATLDGAGVFPGARVLDVGCGTGTLALEAKRRAGGDGRVSGIDASHEMIARAREKAAGAGLPLELEVASAESLPFADDSYDVVLCSLALHHLHGNRRRAAVTEMHRVLRPAGRLLIVDLSPEAGLLASLNPVAVLHRRSGDITREAEALLAEAGFQDLASGEVGVRNLRFVLGTKPRRGG